MVGLEKNWLSVDGLLPLAVVWCLLAALSSLWLLPHIKGALVGYQWATRMHGFGGPETEWT